MSTVSQWVSQHQILLNLLVLPVFSGVVAWVSSWLSVRRALRSEKERREHEAVSQISEFRQKWINELRDRLSEYAAITSVHSRDHETDKAVVGLVFKIELLMNPNDADFDQLRKALKYRADAQVLGGTERLDPMDDSLMEVSQRILKREWKRLKDEMRNPSKFVDTA